MLFQKPEPKCQICAQDTETAIAFVGLYQDQDKVAGLLALCGYCLKRVADFLGSMRRIEVERSEEVKKSPVQIMLDDWNFLKEIGMTSMPPKKDSE